jgi:hypothetical protein
MGCLLALMSAFAPRFVFLVIWLARPNYVDAVFDTFIFPLLGIIFLPFTTLMYVFLASPPFGVEGWDWLWIGIAALFDLSHYGAVYASRPGSSGYRASPPPPV